VEPPAGDIVPIEIDAWPSIVEADLIAAGLGHGFMFADTDVDHPAKNARAGAESNCRSLAARIGAELLLVVGVDNDNERGRQLRRPYYMGKTPPAQYVPRAAASQPRVGLQNPGGHQLHIPIEVAEQNCSLQKGAAVSL
jgi:hypothetical protein